MKRTSVLVAFLGCLAILFAGCPAPREYVQSYSKSKPDMKGKKLGVLPFACSDPEVQTAVSEATAMYLAQSGIEIVEYARLRRALKDQDLDMAALLAEDSLKTLAAKGNVDYLLTGNVLLTSDHSKRILNASATIVDGSTGDTVLKVMFTPPKRLNTIPEVSQALAMAIEEELGIGPQIKK